VRANLAAEHEPPIELAHDFECRPLARVRAQTIANRRGTGREGQKPPGSGDQLTIGGGIADLFRRDVGLLGSAENAERDQARASGCRRREGRLREAPPHLGKIRCALWQDIAPRRVGAVLVRRGQNGIPPLWIEVAVVPGGVFIDDRSGGGVRG
jgi:hypothetical protein